MPTVAAAANNGQVDSDQVLVAVERDTVHATEFRRYPMLVTFGLALHTFIANEQTLLFSLEDFICNY
jgi:hypothetical protein